MLGNGLIGENNGFDVPRVKTNLGQLQTHFNVRVNKCNLSLPGPQDM